MTHVPDFERQEAVAGLLQLNVAHMESTQRNVYVHQTNPSTSTDNTGNIPADAVGPNPMIKPETIAYSVTIIEDTANILDTAEDIIPMTKHKTTANDGVPQINVTYRTGELRETPGYIFNTADIIGKGSISIVYFGRKKSNGNVVAAKVFNASGSHNIETEVLSSLDHENIVKFLDFQYEKDSHLPVLIMEYCEDGSLQIMLDKPEFMFGLLEDELIIFLKDFKCAIFYLKQKNIVHRDIKPGNILRARKEDGRSQYKLTDFSSARKLTDDETYDSVHGTMEYMCPAMFLKGILGKSIPKKFDITTDLWSIGVTIYYAVVGTVSFRPFAGRDDKNTMYRMISEKPHGAISASQNEENGTIVYSKRLPNSVQIPGTLQDLIIDVIAGLLDGKQVLSYEQFFIKVIVVDAKIKFTIFYCCIGQDIVIYMNPKDKYANLQEEIAVVTEIPASNQLLLVADQELTEIVCVTDEMNSYPLSIQQGRLFLYQYQIIVTTSVGLIKILELPDTSLRHSLNDDARMAKKCTAVAYHICRIHKCVIDSQVQLIQSLSNLRRYIYRIICQSNICILDLKRCSDETRKRLSIVFTVFPGFNSMTKLFIEFHDPGNVREVGEMKKLVTEISKLLEETSFDAFQKKIEGRVQEVEKYIEVLTRKIHEQEMAANMDCVRCCEAEHCHGKIERKKKEILDVMNIFLRHMRYETLHDHEQFIHESEKHNLDVLCSKLLSTVQDHCVPAYYQLYENVMKHLHLLTKHLGRVRKVEQNIDAIKESQKQISFQLGKFEDVCVRKMNDILSYITKLMSSTSQGATGESTRQSESVHRVTNMLQELKIPSQEVRDDLREQMTRLPNDQPLHPDQCHTEESLQQNKH